MPDESHAEWSPAEYREWQAPPSVIAEDRRIGWLNESVEEGQAWLKSQRGFPDFRKALEVLSGRDTTARAITTADYRSRLNPNPLKRDVREIVGTLAKLRPMWGYHSDNISYADNAQMMNNVTRAIYLERFLDLRIKDSLRWTASTGRGWVRPVYRRAMYGTGRGDIEFYTYGAPSVLPNQLPSTNDWQNAYVVHFLEEMPVAMAHGMFPAFQHRLRPSSSRYWYQSDGVRKAAQGNLMQRIFGRGSRGAGAAALSDLLVPFRYSYVLDLSVNTTKYPIPMGEPNSSWSYTVPYIGQDIPVGFDPRSGHQIYRKADANDARLYPYRRLIISTDTCITYDGPGFDWHGLVPGVSFCLDSWPWEPLGFSLVHEGFELNEAIKELDRGNMDKARAKLDMSLAYDTNAISRREAASVDPLMPRGRYGYDGSATEGTPFTPVVPPKVYKIEPADLEFRKMLEENLHSQLAIHDVMALAKLRAVGSMDELEKIMEANGPIVEDMSRSMEPPIRDLGIMLKYLVLQFMTTSRIMQYVGEDGVTRETFDYDPASLVPSHLPGEDPKQGSPTDKIVRARTFADNLRFFILPNSLHEMQQIQMKLLLIQLRKAGVWIDSQTIAEASNVPAYGKIPGNTVIERYWNEKEQEIQHMARLKEFAEGAGLTPPGGAEPGKNPEGRPNAMTAPPKLAQKEGGARSTITTSK